MGYAYPDDLYCDVRIEDVAETMLQNTLGTWDQVRERAYRAAFVRVYDGSRWYYASTTEVESIQDEIDRLAALSTPNPSVHDDPAIRLLETNTGDHRVFTGDADITTVDIDRKVELLSSYFPHVADKPYVDVWRGAYVDQHVVKTFSSSKGADLTFDYQRVGFRILFQLSNGDDNFTDMFDKARNTLDGLDQLHEECSAAYDRAVEFLLNAVNVEPGTYPVVLSPMAAGVFAHESFGHKSESDSMVGDETLMKEWVLGKQVGAPILSIVEDGRLDGVGRIPFDDEGTHARRNYLIRNGVLTGRLHSATTAAALGEELTANARAKDFEFEPIVRMTTTYIEKGSHTFDELIAGVEKGVLVKSINHGSGMSTFTIAPSLAYMIRDGMIAEPVKISVVTGNVFKTLSDIDAVSDEVELLSFALGGCGKMEQFPLPVGFGGPWVRVSELTVR
jgi:TldD protein